MTDQEPLTTAELVLLALDQVPRGRVVSYGDLAALVGTSARRVGAVMAHHGHRSTWWRVVNRLGELPIEGAEEHWRDEAITITAPGRCRIAAHRADLVALANDYDQALGELGHPGR